MTRRRTRQRKDGLNGPLARWGFTALTALAVWSDLMWPAILAGGLAAAAWNSNNRPRRRRRTRRRR